MSLVYFLCNGFNGIDHYLETEDNFLENSHAFYKSGLPIQITPLKESPASAQRVFLPKVNPM